jgi:hypothetical protein
VVDYQKLKVRVLDDGTIDEDDVDLICRELYPEGKIDNRVVQFLITLRNEAERVCPLFEQFFFEAVEFNVLVDGRIDRKETAWLGRMLFSDDKIDEHEMRFLWNLKRRAKWICLEFQQLYDECMSDSQPRECKPAHRPSGPSQQREFDRKSGGGK